MHVIGTAGHVDHGKSTLVERLTGIDPDRFAEEKRRGLTIDLGFAWLPLPSGREIGLIDVPGHERFIKNMLAGAGGISVCLFVVAANEGWMPQSAEHLAVLHILGIRHAVVALTKADLVDDETVELARAEVEERIAVSSLTGAPIVTCSAVTGAGVDELVREIDRVVSLAGALPDRGRPRLWVDRVFTIAGAGTVVTGTLTGGVLSVGDEIEIAPQGRRARVRTIQSHKREVASITPGNRVALNLAGLQRQGAQRGDAIVKPGRWRATRQVDVHIEALARAFEHLPPGVELTEKGAHLLYCGSAETPVRLKLLDRARVAPGEGAFAQLYLRDALPLERGDRFVLRDAGRVLTLGGGVVLDPLPRPARRGDTARAELLERLVDASPSEALLALVESEGQIDARSAEARSGASVSEVSGGRVLGQYVLSARRAGELQERTRAGLADYHAAHPLERGMPREALRTALALEPEVFDGLLGSVDGIEEDGAVVRLSSHQVALAPEQRRARDELFARLEAAGFQPPLAGELNGDAGLLRALVDAGELVRVGDFYLTSGQAQEARRRVRSAIEERGALTVAEIRDLLGTSRKYAIPLCEWLDASGATRRVGDRRALGPRP